jgi:K+-transporting ATPase ATPase C chain
MLTYASTALRVTICSIVLLGLLYPIAMTGIAQALFPSQANGSFVVHDGRVVGSSSIGQRWTSPRYFHGRPSAAGNGYDPTQTGGTNLGPSSKKLLDATRATIEALRKENPDVPGTPPIDLVTASGSGIDPDISPAAAFYQVPRIARVRGLSISAVDALVRSHIEGRTFGVLGEPRVNVLALNLALDDAR